MNRTISVPEPGTKFKGTGYFVKYAKSRIKRKKNMLMVIVGQTGSGKSYAALDLMKELAGDRFDMKHVHFRAKDFVADLNSGTLQPGDVILWDESGVDLNAKQWMSLANRIVNLILQTFRNKHLIVIFTLPYVSFLDSDTRKLLHAIIQTQSIDYDEKTTTLKPFLIQINQETGKMYRKYLRVKTEEGRTVPVKKIKTSIPPEDVLKSYEDKKTEFTNKLNQDIEIMFDRMEEKERLKYESPKKLTKKQEEIYELYKKLGQVVKVAAHLGIRPSGVSEQLRYIRKKLNLEEIPIENQENQGILVNTVPRQFNSSLNSGSRSTDDETGQIVTTNN